MKNAKSQRSGIVLAIALALSLILPAVVQGSRGELINIEEAAEVSDLSLKLTSNNRARIYASICDQCKLLSLEVTQDTIIMRGGQRLSLEDAQLIGKAGATVLFTPETLEVTRILYWQ